VTARTNNDLDNLAAIMQKRGLVFLRLNKDTSDDPLKPGIRLATMHRGKGLEFDITVIAGYQGVQHYVTQFSRDGDTEVAERCVLYITATRAKRHLC
jgi:superfamily I DNA/RNA helicase